MHSTYILTSRDLTTTETIIHLIRIPIILSITLLILILKIIGLVYIELVLRTLYRHLFLVLYQLPLAATNCLDILWPNGTRFLFTVPDGKQTHILGQDLLLEASVTRN